MDGKAIAGIPLVSIDLLNSGYKFIQSSFSTNDTNAPVIRIRLATLKDIKSQRRKTIGQHYIKITDSTPIFAETYRISESMASQVDR